MKRSLTAFALVAPLLATSPAMADNSRDTVGNAYNTLQDYLYTPQFEAFYNRHLKPYKSTSRTANDFLYFAGVLKTGAANDRPGQDNFVMQTNLTSCSAKSMVRISARLQLPYNHHFRKTADSAYASMINATNGATQTQDCSVFKRFLVRALGGN